MVGARDQRTVVIDPAFVGRDEQLGMLTDGLDHVIRGGSESVFMSSESGMGKTRLLNEIARAAARKGFMILHGATSQDAGQPPCAPWLQMVDQLSVMIQSDRVLRERTEHRMRDYREEVITAMPKLAKALRWTGRPLSGPDELGQSRVISAFRTLMSEMGTSDRNVMLTIDDCQWLDDQSQRILAEICSLRSSHLFLFAVARPHEGCSEKLRDSVGFTRKMSLQRLNDEAIGRLANSMAGQLPPAAIDVVRRYAEGSPFMASAVLRGMVESGVLVRKENEWNINEQALSGFQAADNASAILIGRLAQLPKKSRRLLSAAAVVGKSFNPDTAAALVGMNSTEVLSALKPVREHRLVWSRPERRGRVCS